MSSRYDFVDSNSIDIGASFDSIITWKSGEPALPVNVSPYSAEFKIFDLLTNSTLLTATNSNGKIVLGGSAGTINIKLSTSDTSLFSKGTYGYSLILAASSNDTQKLLYGEVAFR